MSVCLQGMVDELLNQKDGTDLNNVQVCANIPNKYFKRYKFDYTTFTDAHHPPTATNIRSTWRQKSTNIRIKFHWHDIQSRKYSLFIQTTDKY